MMYFSKEPGVGPDKITPHFSKDLDIEPNADTGLNFLSLLPKLLNHIGED